MEERYQAMVRAFLDAAAVATDLVGSAEAGARWTRPSLLPELTVAGLAGHLALVLRRVVHRLDEPEPDPAAQEVELDLTVMRVTEPADLQRPEHRTVRRDGGYVASFGREALLERMRTNLAALDRRLPGCSGDRRLIGPFPDTAMRLHPYLTTRIVEVVVHTDDLAHSIGAPVEPPPAAVEIAASTLLEASRRAVGDLTVVRALTRSDRQPITALMVF